MLFLINSIIKGMLQSIMRSPEYEKVFWVGHGTTGEVIIFLALFHPAGNSCSGSFAHVALDPGSALHLVSDVLRQEAIETLLILASLNPLRAEERGHEEYLFRGRLLPEEKAEVVIELDTFAAINTKLVESSTL